jgi:hypothetical protein
LFSPDNKEISSFKYQELKEDIQKEEDVIEKKEIKEDNNIST